MNESDHGEHIDTAIHSSSIDVIKDEYIDIDNIHNVYAMESMITQMAIILFEEKIQEYSKIHIFIDNQSMIQTIESPKRQSG